MRFWKSKAKAIDSETEFSIKFILEPSNGNVSIVCNWPKPTNDEAENEIAHKFAMLIASCSNAAVAEYIQQAVTQKATLMGCPDISNKILYWLTTMPMGSKQPIDGNPDAPVVEPVRAFRRD